MTINCIQFICRFKNHFFIRKNATGLLHEMEYKKATPSSHRTSKIRITIEKH